MDPVTVFVLLLAGILTLGALGEFIFQRTGVPDVIWLVSAGILVGPVLGIISPDQVKPSVPFIGALALIVIISSSAYQLRLNDVLSAAPRGIGLSACSFLASVLAVWAFCTGAEWIGVINGSSDLEYIIFGTIIGGSSALVIMPTMSGRRSDPRVSRLLEVESTLTDIFCIVVAMTLIDTYLRGYSDISAMVGDFGIQLGFGLVFGLVGGALGVVALTRLRGVDNAYSLILAGLLIVYAVTSVMRGSAAMAVLVTAIVMGNSAVIRKKLGFVTEIYDAKLDRKALVIDRHMVFLAKSFFFVLIGLLFPVSVRSIVLGGLCGLTLLVFRYPAVALALRGSRLSPGQRSLVAIAVPRGLAAGVLSTVPYYRGMTHLENLYHIFFACIVSTIFIFTVCFAYYGRRGTTS